MARSRSFAAPRGDYHMFPVARLEAPGGQAPTGLALQATQLVGSGTVKGGHVKRWKISFGCSKWWRLERLKRARSKIHKSRTAESPTSLKREPRACRQYSVSVGNEIEIQIFTGGAWLRPDIRRVSPSRQHNAMTTTSAAVQGDALQPWPGRRTNSRRRPSSWCWCRSGSDRS